MEGHIGFNTFATLASGLADYWLGLSWMSICWFAEWAMRHRQCFPSCKAVTPEHDMMQAMKTWNNGQMEVGFVPPS